MAKVYTDVTHPDHRLIKAAKRIGLTGVRFTWYSAMDRGRRGWRLQCDQLAWFSFKWYSVTEVQKYLQNGYLNKETGVFWLPSVR